MNVVEASVTLAEAEELIRIVMTSDAPPRTKWAALQAADKLQEFRNGYLDRMRQAASIRHPPKAPQPPTRTANIRNFGALNPEAQEEQRRLVDATTTAR